MKHSLIYILLIILGTSALSSQSLRIERTDVDSTRSSFITATYIFGIDVIFDDIADCSGAAFEIIYNHAEYIKFSEYSLYEFGSGTTPVVIHNVDIDGRGHINVGIGSGLSTITKTFDNPRVIKLEFVVMQYAPRNIDVTLSFPNPKAIIAGDFGGEIIPLNAEDVVYKIHSYIDVWPGDADNNGRVDNDDLGIVQKYLGLGSYTKNMRSFKRLNASTVWTKQQVLAWDRYDATFADCDGSGDITNSDMLVIAYNWNRDTTMQSVEIKQSPSDAVQGSKIRLLSADEVSIPIYIESSKPYHAVSGEIDLSHLKEFEFIELAKGNVFNDAAFFRYKYDETNSKVSFASGNTSDRRLPEYRGIVANAILKKADELAEIPKQLNVSMTAISESGHFFRPHNITSVDNESLNSYESYASAAFVDEQLHINSQLEIKSIDIYSTLGELLYRSHDFSNSYAVQLPNIPSGIYFALITTSSNETYALSFSVVK